MNYDNNCTIKVVLIMMTLVILGLLALYAVVPNLIQILNYHLDSLITNFVNENS